jgi:hypothetical protein
VPATLSVRSQQLINTSLMITTRICGLLSVHTVVRGRVVQIVATDGLFVR